MVSFHVLAAPLLLLVAGPAAAQNVHRSGFMKDCRDWVFDANQVAVNATCGNLRSIMHLGRCYVNVNGHVESRKKGKFDRTCRDWPQTGYTDLHHFPVRCYNNKGDLVSSVLDLNNDIGALDGSMICWDEMAHTIGSA